MQLNKHGIPVNTPRKHTNRIPLDYELDQVTLFQLVEGQEVTLVLPRFSPIVRFMKSHGWRKLKEVR